MQKKFLFIAFFALISTVKVAQAGAGIKLLLQVWNLWGPGNRRPARLVTRPARPIVVVRAAVAEENLRPV